MPDGSYDTINGKFIHRTIANKAAPCPPKWVRERTRFSKRYEYASLAKELEFFFPEAREICVNYVKEWPENRRLGTGLLLTSLPPWELTFLACGVGNEIMMRFAKKSDFSISWLSVTKGLPLVMDARSHNAQFYQQLRNEYFSTDVLIVDSVGDIEDFREGFWFIKQLYVHRHDNFLPTITTLPHHSPESLMDVLSKDLGTMIIEDAGEYIF